MPEIRAVLLDIDGVLVVSWEPIPGAVEAVAGLRSAGYPIALVTNTSSRSRDWIAATLHAAGFPVAAPDILTVGALTAAYLAEHHPGARCVLLNHGDIGDDLAGVDLVGIDDPAPDVVILGAAGPVFDYDSLNRVFGFVRAGAALVAMNRNLYFRTSAGLQLDTGSYLAGLELAAGTTAAVTGKPSEQFFATALRLVGANPGEAVMVGDDLDIDVLAAQAAGLTGVLVRTGKYHAETVRAAPVQPQHLINSVADLPALLASPPAPGFAEG